MKFKVEAYVLVPVEVEIDVDEGAEQWEILSGRMTVPADEWLSYLYEHTETDLDEAVAERIGQ